MLTYLEKKASVLVYFAILWLSASCTIVLKNPTNSADYVTLKFTAPTSIPTYTCAAFSASAVDLYDAPYKSTTNTLVTLSGLGQGHVYTSLSDCKAGTNATTSLFISAGSSNLSFYYRTAAAENLTVTATTGSNTATFSVNTTLFQVVGQVSASRSMQLEKGLLSPISVYSDGTHLYVADRGNNRVLGWNTIPTSNGTPPDFVLGQPNLNGNSPNFGGVSASTLNAPWGVFGDGTHLFVADQNNHRVLVWNSMPTTNGKAADLVIGQVNLTSNVAPSASSTTLYSPTAIYTNGTLLYIVDGGFNRVMGWNAIPNSNGVAANFVLGQPNFSSTSANSGVSPSWMACCATTASSFYNPSGIYSDGTRLYVADRSNARVVGWNALPTSTGQPADFALGQANLTAHTFAAVSSSSLGANGLSVSGDGSHLYVVDSDRYRVLVWNSMPNSNNQAADLVLGQPNFTTSTSNNGGVSAVSFSSLYGIFSDGARLFVVDGGINRVLIWNSAPTTTRQPANLVLGQSSMVSSTDTWNSASSFANAATASQPYSVYNDGTHLFMADGRNNRVLMWNTIPTSDGTPADIVLGQPDFNSTSYNSASTSGATMGSPTSVYSDGIHLFVSDEWNNRVLVWNTMPTTNGQAADFALGQTNLTSIGSGTSATTLSSPIYVTGDGTRLFVSDYNNARVLVWNATPTGNGQAANLVIGQSNFVTASQWLTTSSSVARPWGISISGHQLFIADAGNNRIMVWNSIPTSNNQAADFAVGQPDFVSSNSDVTAATMNWPSGVSSDGTHLFVADNSNSRVLVWNTIPTTFGQPADAVIGQPDLLTGVENYGGLSSSSLDYPTDVYSDGTRVFISDNSNNRILILPVPGT